MSEIDGTGTFSFPSFHERPAEYSAGDKARIAFTQILRTLITESMTSTAGAGDYERAT